MQYQNSWRASGIIPKFIHIFKNAPILEDHTVPWAERTGTGFGLLGEQGAESIHARFNSLQRTYQCIHNKVDRLLSIVKEHSLSDCGIYSTAKQTSKIVGSQHSILCYHDISNTYSTSEHGGSNHSILHTRIPSQRKSMATVPYYPL